MDNEQLAEDTVAIDPQAILDTAEASSDDWEDPPVVEQATNGNDADLFGEDSDNEDNMDDQIFVHQQQREEQLSDSDQVQEVEEFQEAKRVEIQIEVAHPPQNEATQQFLLKVPNFLVVDPVAFQPEYFEPLKRNLEDPDASLKARHQLQHTIRWRRQGSSITSNARLVKWSDGSMTIRVGQTHFPISKGAQYSQNIYWRHSINVLETDKEKFRVHTSLSVMPNGTVFNLASNNVEEIQDIKSKTKFISDFNDPQARRRQHEQIEQERIRSQKRTRTQQRRQQRDYLSDEEDADDMLLVGGRQSKSQMEAKTQLDEYDEDFVVDDDAELETYEDADVGVLSSDEEEEQQVKKLKMVITDD